MRVHRRRVTKKLVHQLYELACTPFTLADFHAKWNAFRWSYKPGLGDEFGFRVRVPGCWSLTVDPLGSEIIGADLPFYYWEAYEPEWHDNPTEYRRERRAYDAEFESASKLALNLLPRPFLRWTNDDEDAHRALVWQGEHGLLLLQQASFDPQFGIEIDFWLEKCSASRFHPTTPLIDWLCKRSRRLHDKQGFPALSW
jgi:hypothetical protein